MSDSPAPSLRAAEEVAAVVAEIEAVINLATGGTWRYAHPGCVRAGGLIASTQWPAQETPDWPQRERDARYLVAVRPTNVQRLLDALRAERQAGQQEVFVAMANYARSGDSAVFEERMFDAIGDVKAALAAARRDAQEG